MGCVNCATLFALCSQPLYDMVMMMKSWHGYDVSYICLGCYTFHMCVVLATLHLFKIFSSHYIWEIHIKTLYIFCFDDTTYTTHAHIELIVALLLYLNDAAHVVWLVLLEFYQLLKMHWYFVRNVYRCNCRLCFISIYDLHLLET